MAFFKKKQPVEQPKVLTPQDFEETQEIPAEYPSQEIPQQQGFVNRMQGIGQQIDNISGAVSNAVMAQPSQVPNTVPLQQVRVPQKPQVQQQPEVGNDEIVAAIQDLDLRVSHIEQWLFRRSK